MVHTESRLEFEKSPITLKFVSFDGKYPENYKFENYFSFEVSSGAFWLKENLKKVTPTECL